MNRETQSSQCKTPALTSENQAEKIELDRKIQRIETLVLQTIHGGKGSVAQTDASCIRMLCASPIPPIAPWTNLEEL